MKQIKRILLVFTLILLVLSLAACGQKPDVTVTKFFDASKTADTATMAQLMHHEGNKGTFNYNGMTTDQINMLKTIMENDKVEILSSDVNGDNATVKTKITSIDIVKIYNQITANMMANALIYINVPSDQIQKQLMQTFNNAISDPNAPKVVTNVDVQLIKENGQWKIMPTDDLTNAMTGNFNKTFNGSFNN